ncbi:MAG: hypothetical protein GTO14_03530 [Anaerolineales bacterium]|nr:hypothetical protein [Anaerolineales bacterium]
MKDKRILRIGALVLVLICLMIALVGWIFQTRMRANLRELRPLVLIHTPHNQQKFALGEAVTIHAIVREQGGVERIELWVDGDFVTEEIAPEEVPTSLVLHTAWTADSVGMHSIIIRARSAGGVEGQASLRVEVLGEIFPPEEGEVGADLAPAGTEDDQPAVGVGLAPSGNAMEPEEHVAAPGSVEEVAERLGVPSVDAPARGDEPLVLRVEILGLQTDRHYGGLHCYLGSGDIPPRWYPDEDGDQSTDESFPSLGGGAWDVASTLSGELAPSFPTTSMDPIDLDVTCVGLTHGGMEAVEIGRVFKSIGPDEWDGITRRAGSTDIEGHFDLDYRVGSAVGSAPGHRIELDLGMTPPINLRLGAWTLEWDYQPRPGEEEIDGFRVFLNDVLQWTEPADARQSYLPYEWVNPPCEQDYRFHVDAFRGEDWSPASNTLTIPGGEPGSEECERTLIVEFETLETFDLGRDQDHDDWVGPVDGSFYAGDQEVRFDTRCSGSGRLCDIMGLGHFETYSIHDLTTNWGSGTSTIIVNVPPDEDLVVGFAITDHDWRDTDPVCADWRPIWSEDMDRVQHTGVGGREVGCDVSFTVRPAFGSPRGEAGGPPPLPLLGVTNLTVDEDTGRLEIHVRNNGTATWPGRDLDVIVRWPSGALIGQYVFPELILQPGRTIILHDPELVPGPYPPLGACVLLDPGNQVPEEDDYWPGWTRGEWCRPLPDLTLTDVVVDQVNGRLLATVQNIGPGSIENRTLNLEIRLQDDRTIVPEHGWSDVSMEPWEARVLIWEAMPEGVREILMEGYQVIVDPYNRIAETDGFNNTYTVPAGGDFRIMWVAVDVPYYLFWNAYDQRFTNEDTFFTRVIAETEGTTRLLADWEESCTVHEMADHVDHYECMGDDLYEEVELEGDETVAFFMSGFLHVGPACMGECDYQLGYGVIRVRPEEWSEAGRCRTSGERHLPVSGLLYPPDLVGDGWRVYYEICRLGE